MLCNLSKHNTTYTIQIQTLRDKWLGSNAGSYRGQAADPVLAEPFSTDYLERLYLS